MKKLILIVALSMGVSITHGQEYKVVCKRLSGCPVINGTCPTCEILLEKNLPVKSWMKRLMGC